VAILGDDIGGNGIGLSNSVRQANLSRNGTNEGGTMVTLVGTDGSHEGWSKCWLVTILLESYSEALMFSRVRE
jgi:hypothetical protein